MMRYLLILLFSINALSFSPCLPFEEMIEWNESRPLSWGDYRGKPERRNSIASTYYSLKRYVTNHGEWATVKIVAVFYPNESWKRRRKKGVLQHEQRHFDIVELFARKLRKQIRNENYNDFQELEDKLDKHFKKIEKELDIYQDKYDRATNHSRNSPRQAKWNSLVLVQLDEYAAYKENTFKVYFANQGTK